MNEPSGPPPAPLSQADGDHPDVQARVAFCIAGQLRYEQLAFPHIAGMARAIGAAVFVSTWRRRGGKASGEINRDQAGRMFGPHFGDALPERLAHGRNFDAAFPDFEQVSRDSFSLVTPEQIRAHFPHAVIDIEDETMALDFERPATPDTNSLRMLYKVWRCNQLRRRAERRRGARFDLVVRLRPDTIPDLSPETVAEMLHGAQGRRIYIPALVPGLRSYTDVMAISSSEVADTYAALFGKAVLEPSRKWRGIHTELFEHLTEAGVEAAPAALREWIVEEYRESQPSNRGHLLRLLAEQRFNASHFERPGTWATVRSLLIAADLAARGGSVGEIETQIGTMALDGEGLELLFRTATLLAAVYLRDGNRAAYYGTQLAALLCRTEETRGRCLEPLHVRDCVAGLSALAGELGLRERLGWHSLTEVSALVDAGGFHQIHVAACHAVPQESRAACEATLQAVLPPARAETPEGEAEQADLQGQTSP